MLGAIRLARKKQFCVHMYSLTTYEIPERPPVCMLSTKIYNHYQVLSKM